MVDQSHHLLGRNAGRSPVAAWTQLSPEALARLYGDLREHVRDRFPGRIDDATTDDLIAEVLARWFSGPLRDAAGEPARGLTADMNRAALAWLRETGTIPAESPEYDDLFARTVFHGKFDAGEIRAAMHTLVANDQPIEFRIVTYYLDEAELDGSPSPLAALARRMHIAPHGPSAEYVRNTMVDFYRLLAVQRANCTPGTESS